jgi:hypothetical protein
MSEPRRDVVDGMTMVVTMTGMANEQVQGRGRSSSETRTTHGFGPPVDVLVVGTPLDPWNENATGSSEQGHGADAADPHDARPRTVGPRARDQLEHPTRFGPRRIGAPRTARLLAKAVGTLTASRAAVQPAAPGWPPEELPDAAFEQTLAAAGRSGGPWARAHRSAGAVSPSGSRGIHADKLGVNSPPPPPQGGTPWTTLRRCDTSTT